MSYTERRREPRKNVRGVKSWLLGKEGQREPCNIVNLSRKGACVESRRPMLPGMLVEMAFIRSEDNKVTRMVRRCGNVVRRIPRGFAVSFTYPRSCTKALRYRSLLK